MYIKCTLVCWFFCCWWETDKLGVICMSSNTQNVPSQVVGNITILWQFTYTIVLFLIAHTMMKYHLFSVKHGRWRLSSKNNWIIKVACSNEHSIRYTLLALLGWSLIRLKVMQIRWFSAYKSNDMNYFNNIYRQLKDIGQWSLFFI